MLKTFIAAAATAITASSKAANGTHRDDFDGRRGSDDRAAVGSYDEVTGVPCLGCGSATGSVRSSVKE